MLALALPATLASCGVEGSSTQARFPLRGAWLKPREGFPLDSEHGDAALRRMRGYGVTHVAVGQDVYLPRMAEPRLEWGRDDAALRGVLRRIRAAGLKAFLLPRIESPDFFRPPYPFRADIAFPDAATWERFHQQVEGYCLHYGRLAQVEGVAILGLGLELKQSAKTHPDRWRKIAAATRGVFRGALVYSANWWDEWEDITFWDAVDYVGVGAYFELKGDPPARTVAEAVALWAPIRARLEAAAEKAGRPILFTEIGYTGYADTLERPWEWAGKQDKNAPIDHARQALAYEALFAAWGERPRFAGLFVWGFHTDRQWVQPWEYAFEDRPAGEVLRRAYRGR